MLDLFTSFSAPLLAAAAIKWTPVTFYVTMGIVDTIVVLVGFRMMGVDPEHNSFIGAIIAAGIFNAVAYFTKDAGVVGFLIASASVFGLLAAVSSGEALKALGMTVVVFAIYGLGGKFIVARTPLNMDDIAGIPRMVATGGMKAEPITEKDEDNLSKAYGTNGNTDSSP